VEKRRVLGRYKDFVTLFALLAALTLTQSSSAQTLTVLHPFSNRGDGSGPMAGVRMDRAGNIYGTTVYGGTGNRGTVWRLSPKNGGWFFTPLYSFHDSSDGNGPMSKVTVGPDGALYGTTPSGGGTGCGGQGCGIVFKLTPPASFCQNILCSWTETVIHRFDDNPAQASLPLAAVVFDSAGNLYGTAGSGGGGCYNYGCGVVYEMTQSGGSWNFNVIYDFSSGDGALPFAGVTLDAAGNLYGTTAYGGPYAFGNVYRLLRSAGGWTYTSLYSFTDGDDGAMPTSEVVLDQAGNIYGDDTQGGASGGVVWELSPSGGGWNFTAIDSPYCCITAGVSRDAAGNLYVVTWSGGQNQTGAIYELSYSGGTWTETNLHSFADHDGAFPYSDVVFDAGGNLYGTTTSGGTGNDGTVWQFSR